MTNQINSNNLEQITSLINLIKKANRIASAANSGELTVSRVTTGEPVALFPIEFASESLLQVIDNSCTKIVDTAVRDVVQQAVSALEELGVDLDTGLYSHLVQDPEDKL